MEKCTVCLKELSSSSLKPVCGHEFHMECLLEWIKKNENCPSCLQVLSKSFIMEEAKASLFANKDFYNFTKRELFELLELVLKFEDFPFEIENIFERLDVIGWNEEEKNITFNSACTNGHLKAARYLLNTYKVSIKESLFQHLKWACDKGFYEFVKVLIEAGADVKQVEPDGMNLLHRACYASSPETVAILLGTRKFDVNKNYDRLDGERSIHIAARKGDLEIVKILVENGANLDLKGFFLETPLIVSLNSGHVEVAKFLIKNGALFEKDSRDPLEALCLACSMGNISMVKYLAELGVDINYESNNDSTPLIVVCENGNLEIAKFLIEKGADIDKKSDRFDPALLGACEHGNTEIVELLIQSGANLRASGSYGNTAWIAVARSGNIECCEILLNGGLDINFEVEDSHLVPFLTAIFYNNLDILKKFLESGMIVWEERKRAGLISAIEEGFTEIVEYFISLGFNLNVIFNSVTPLNLACQLNRTEIALKLIEAGANLNAACGKGYYPIHYVCETGNMAILESLIENGADLNVIRETDHMSTVYSATIHNNFEILEKLLLSGANPNLKHISGEIALHKAISSKKIKFVELLLKFGADAKIKNKKNISSHDLLLKSSEFSNEKSLNDTMEHMKLNGE